MARIMGIDYGAKRCGIAATDTLQIAVHPVKALPQIDLMDFLNDYVSKEEVEQIVFGRPVHRDGNFTSLNNDIDKFILEFSARNPAISIAFQDESYSSKEAAEILVKTNKKKVRRDKTKLDVLSAVIILQRFLNHI